MRVSLALGTEVDICSSDELRVVGDDIVDRVGGMLGPRYPIHRGQRRSVVVPLDINGDGVGLFPNNNSASLYVVRRISAIALGGNQTTLTIWQGNDFVDTLQGVEDGASWAANDAPLYQRRGEALRLEFDNGNTVNGSGIVTVFYDEVIGA